MSCHWAGRRARTARYSATWPQAWMQPENWEFETHTQQHWAEQIAHLHELNRISEQACASTAVEARASRGRQKMGMRGGGLFPEVDGSARDLPQHGAEGLLPPDRVSFRRRVNARGDLGHGKPQVDQGPGALSASRRIVIICSSVDRVFFMTPSLFRGRPSLKRQLVRKSPSRSNVHGAAHTVV